MASPGYTPALPAEPSRSAQSLFLPSPTVAAVAVAALTLVAAVLRLHLLAARSLWIDEAASVHFANLAWWPFLRLLWGSQGNMTLYYFLLRAWVHLGESEAAVRGLSVLFGVLTIPAVYALGARMFDRGTGLAGAAILTEHSFHIEWSQEARAYSLLTLLLVLTTYFLVRAMDSPRAWRYWAAASVSAALAVYAHIFAVLVLPAYALAVIFQKPFTVKLRTLAAAVAGFAFMVFPISAFVVLQRSGQIDWIPRPTMSEIYQFLELLTGQGGWWLVAVYLLLCGLALSAVGGPRSAREKWALRLLLLWLLAPPFLTLAVTPVKPLFFPRYMIMCVPALVLLAARGITRIAVIRPAGRPVAAACLVVVLSLSTWGTDRYFAGAANPTENWRAAVAYIVQRDRAGDGAVFFLPNIYAYSYYVQHSPNRQRAANAPDVLYPSVPRHPLSHDEVLRVTSGRSRVWLILCNESVDLQAASTMESALGERFQRLDSRAFQGEDPITVILYSRPPAAAAQ